MTFGVCIFYGGGNTFESRHFLFSFFCRKFILPIFGSPFYVNLPPCFTNDIYLHAFSILLFFWGRRKCSDGINNDYTFLFLIQWNTMIMHRTICHLFCEFNRNGNGEIWRLFELRNWFMNLTQELDKLIGIWHMGFWLYVWYIYLLFKHVWLWRGIRWFFFSRKIYKYT